METTYVITISRFQHPQNDVNVHPRLYIETQHSCKKQINWDQRNDIKITFS